METPWCVEAQCNLRMTTESGSVWLEGGSRVCHSLRELKCLAYWQCGQSRAEDKPASRILTSNMDSLRAPTVVGPLVKTAFLFSISLPLAMQKLCHQVAMWSHCTRCGIEVVGQGLPFKKMDLYSSQKIIYIQNYDLFKYNFGDKSKIYNWGYLHCLFPNYLPLSNPAYEGVNAALP